jgi:hypothetical protein
MFISYHARRRLIFVTFSHKKSNHASVNIPKWINPQRDGGICNDVDDDDDSLKCIKSR